jgi:arginine-tRNA-protein transferase
MGHPCSYLAGREATSVVVDPTAKLSPSAYSALLYQGFRRSGNHVYRPWCRDCQKCISVRIPVTDFSPARRQLRTWRKNDDVEAIPVESRFNPEHYALYRRYMSIRHAGGEMADSSADEFMQFLTSDWAETVFVELRLHNHLAAVAVTDVLPDSLSAVYTFFDPDLADRSPGVLGVLQQITLAKMQGLRWLYLGYWIEPCRKMNYKADYRPIEAFWDGTWHRFEPGEQIELT